MATYFCRADVDSIGFVQIFGSNATGPYLSGFGNNPDYIYEDTKARVNLSISYRPAHYIMGYSALE